MYNRSNTRLTRMMSVNFRFPVARLCIALLFMFVVMPRTAAEPLSDLRFISRSIIQEKSPSANGITQNYFEMNERRLGLVMLLRFYQHFLSSQKIDSCMFEPSCSEYARLTLKKHGVFIGIMKIADRLQRCNGVDRHVYPLDPETGKLYDPP